MEDCLSREFWNELNVNILFFPGHYVRMFSLAKTRINEFLNRYSMDNTNNTSSSDPFRTLEPHILWIILTRLSLRDIMSLRKVSKYTREVCSSLLIRALPEQVSLHHLWNRLLIAFHETSHLLCVKPSTMILQEWQITDLDSLIVKAATCRLPASKVKELLDKYTTNPLHAVEAFIFCWSTASVYGEVMEGIISPGVIPYFPDRLILSQNHLYHKLTKKNLFDTDSEFVNAIVDLIYALRTRPDIGNCRSIMLALLYHRWAERNPSKVGKYRLDNNSTRPEVVIYDLDECTMKTNADIFHDVSKEFQEQFGIDFDGKVDETHPFFIARQLK